MADAFRAHLGALAVCLLFTGGCSGTTEDGVSMPGGGSGGSAGTGGAMGGAAGAQVFPSCNDGSKGQSETDVDCGGACPPCADKKACKSVDDCLSKICTDGVCGGCSAQSKCPGGLACIAGICQPCASNADCAPGQACNAGKCGDCGGSGTCAPGQACVNGACGPCQTSTDCSGGQVCEGGSCKPCATSGQCKPGQICQAGACSPCSTSADCPSGQACVSGACGNCNKSGECATGQVCASGICGPCSATSPCDAGLACVGGSCGPCATTADCPKGLACVGGTCGPCSETSQCGGTDACVNASCTSCAVSSQCGNGKVCDFGRCLTGSLVQMYQCPPSQSLGGGSWGFYGCQGHVSSTSTCTITEYPTSQTFNCSPLGKLALVTDSAPAAAGTTQVSMYQCPPSQSIGGGSWGFYGCQGQLASTPTCTITEYPSSQSFNCTPAGKLSLAAQSPTPAAGGKAVPMYQCPPSQSIGGGSWGFYGCQGQLASTPTCTIIEYPSSQSFNCAAAGTMLLEP